MAAKRPETSGEGNEEYTELVLVVHATNPAEAELFKAELEAAGIPAVLEQRSAAVAGVPDVGAGIPVLVPEDYADRAAEVIAEIESNQLEEEEVNETAELYGTNASEDLDDLDELDELDEDEDWDDEDDEDWDDEDEDDWDDEDEDEDWDDEDDEEY